jgi:hypothetical protein
MSSKLLGKMQNRLLVGSAAPPELGIRRSTLARLLTTVWKDDAKLDTRNVRTVSMPGRRDATEPSHLGLGVIIGCASGARADPVLATPMGFALADALHFGNSPSGGTDASFDRARAGASNSKAFRTLHKEAGMTPAQFPQCMPITRMPRAQAARPTPSVCADDERLSDSRCLLCAVCLRCHAAAIPLKIRWI